MNLKIDISSYIIVLLSFLAGYFEYVFLTFLIIIVHEMGHYFIGKLLKLNISEIRLMSFGGITLLNEDLNSSIIKEILMLISGPLTQIMFYLLVLFLYKLGYVTDFVFTKFSFINITLLKFNLLPILPLDGGKLINNFLDLILPYKTSHIISILISIISLPLVFFIGSKLFVIILMFFLILKIIEEIKISKYKVNKLILERNLKNYKFKKTIVIDNINKVMRNKNYILKGM